MDVSFCDETFDVVICAQIYEHVPIAEKMLTEIRRVLKTGGFCYFAANNRLMFMEPHYRLPFLSIMPQRMADLYLRVTRKVDHYYERHFSYWGLRRLVLPFELIDYTKQIIDDPLRFKASYMIPSGSALQKIAQFISPRAFWALPGQLQ